MDKGSRTLVEPATPDDGPLLERLMQLYSYDFSEFSDLPLNPDGTYGDPEFIREQLGPAHEQFIIRLNTLPAGFAIVSARSRLTGEPGVYDMAQFFILRAHRRSGAGEQAAVALFTQYSGPWEVRVIRSNAIAQRFWRKTIGTFTDGSFEERTMQTDLHDGLLFRFNSDLRD